MAVAQKTLKVAKENAWSLESMPGHEKGHLAVRYVGYELHAEWNQIVCFFRDEQGGWWYEDRVLLPDGRIGSMEEYLFGKLPERPGSWKPKIVNEKRIPKRWKQVAGESEQLAVGTYGRRGA